MTRPANDNQLTPKAAGTALDASRADAQSFELSKVVVATERKAGAVVFYIDVQHLTLHRERNCDARGLGMLVDVIQRLADNLEYFEEALGLAGNFLAGVAG
jgi:hypothetical protein